MKKKLLHVFYPVSFVERIISINRIFPGNQQHLLTCAQGVESFTYTLA